MAALAFVDADLEALVPPEVVLVVWPPAGRRRTARRRHAAVLLPLAVFDVGQDGPLGVDAPQRLDLGRPGALGLLGVEVVLGLVAGQLVLVLGQALGDLVDVELEVLGVLGGRRPGVVEVPPGVVDRVLAGGGAGPERLLGPAHRVGGLGHAGAGGVDVGVVLLLLLGGRPLEQCADAVLGRPHVGLGLLHLGPGRLVVDRGRGAGPPPPAAPSFT